MLILFRYAQVAEKELHASLAEKDPTLRNIDLLIAQYLLYLPESNSSDFSGTVRNVRIPSFKTLSLPSARAWNKGSGMHTSRLIAASASSSMSFVSFNPLRQYWVGSWRICPQFRDAAGKRRLVEKRKTVKHYLDFIKSSQRFYRGYIQKLASCFGGIRELEAVAQKFNLDSVLPRLRIHMGRTQTLTWLRSLF